MKYILEDYDGNIKLLNGLNFIAIVQKIFEENEGSNAVLKKPNTEKDCIDYISNYCPTSWTVKTLDLENKKLWQIAEIISDNWKKISFGAQPYYAAMRTLGSINESYGHDSGRNIVAYFLANASTWKGEIAREVKKHLNNMLLKQIG